ncbi:hypothetical protein [Streptomyces sp. NPDC058202]|uniref:hypothetical protein n=1 Tax=Streptomyces sp. NPDC058202 TaxID=3346380 RepID=UPI0036E41AEE
MGRYRWGRAVAGVALAAAAVGTVSGCGGNADASSAKKKPAAAAPSFAKAAARFEDQLAVECPSMEPDSCWDEMTALMKSARNLRKAMNSEKRGGAGFWTEAYALINKMEKGYAVGEDQGGGERFITNRPAIFGTAHDLSDWMDEHPVK